MKLRDVAGRQIVAIRQGVQQTRPGHRVNLVEAIVLDDKTELRFVTIETEYGFYGIDVIVNKQNKKKGIRQ